MNRIIIAIGLIMAIMSSSPAVASDYDLYKSLQESCGDSACVVDGADAGRLDYLMTKYTNHNTFAELTAKMEWLYANERRLSP